MSPEDPRANAHGQPIGRPVPGWSSRPVPDRSPMHGRYVRLEPLATRHAEALHAAYALAPDGRDWTYLGIERPADAAVYRTFVAEAAASADPLHHAVIDATGGPHHGEPVGTGALMRIDPAQGVLEIGWLSFSPLMQRTPLSTETIRLMAGRAFDELDYRRVEWKCDDLNAPSRAAATRLGFTYEGTFRNALVYKGRNRDTAWFSITAEEWPDVRAGLDAWLDPGNFDADGRQRRTLVACRSRLDGQ